MAKNPGPTRCTGSAQSPAVLVRRPRESNLHVPCKSLGYLPESEARRNRLSLAAVLAFTNNLLLTPVDSGVFPLWIGCSRSAGIFFAFFSLGSNGLPSQQGRFDSGRTLQTSAPDVAVTEAGDEGSAELPCRRSGTHRDKRRAGAAGLHRRARTHSSIGFQTISRARLQTGARPARDAVPRNQTKGCAE